MADNTDKRTGDKIFIDGAYQHNAYYNGKSAQRFWHYAKYEEARKELSVTDGEKVLDAGCGSGVLSYFLAKKTTTEVWGVDANASAISFCRSEYHLENLHFEQVFIDDLIYPPGFFDKIVFLEVIEHLSASQGVAVIRKFYELLSPGGKLVISTPNRRSLWPIIEFTLDKLRLVPNLKDGQHELLYSGTQLKEMTEATGFICHSKKTINFIAPWLSVLSWKLALKMHRLEMNAGSTAGSILLYSFKKPG